MLGQQNVKTMYFKTLNPGLLIQDSDLRLGNMQMLQIFNEFAWLVHLGILGGV